MDAEEARIRALHSLEIVHSASEQCFDDIVSIVRGLYNSPLAWMSFIDRGEQWFKATIGLDIKSTPREISICNTTILDNRILEVGDTLNDDRFSASPLVTSDPGIRYYVGAPLVLANGAVVGALCAADCDPRTPDVTRHDSLAALARHVVFLLQSRKQARWAKRYLGETANRTPSESIPASNDMFPIVDDGPALFLKSVIAARNIAEKAQVARSDFLAMMSHELRTPLSSVLGMSEILLTTPLTPEQREYAEIVKAGGKKLLEKINDVLCLSHPQPGTDKCADTPFNITGLLNAACGALEAPCREKKVELRRMIPSISDQHVGNHHLLSEVVARILDNAIKFTSRGGISVSLEVAECVDQDVFTIKIRDTGTGFSTTALARLFEPFASGAPVLSSSGGGVGLGLYLSKNQLERLKGTLSVESVKQRGAQVTITVPFAKKSS